MKHFLKQIGVMLFILIGFNLAQAGGTVNVVYDPATTAELNDADKSVITGIIEASHVKVKALLPSLTQEINVNVSLTDYNIDVIGGVTGRVDTATDVVVMISTVYPDGFIKAAQGALRATIFHELHHVYRGWTMQGNKFGPGIPIAAVNEGMADVFAETYTGIYHEAASGYPDNVHEWLDEIIALPVNANYSQWMMDSHPDGRTSIGYRVGRYIIHQAMKKTGKNILELSTMSPDEVLGIVLNVK